MHASSSRSLAIAALIVAAPLGAARSADMPLKAPPLPPPPVATWTGCYFGINAGYGWGNEHDNISFLPSPAAFGPPGYFPFSQSDHISGALGGVQVGCNYQYGSSWVVGFETDYDLSDISKSSDAFPPEPGAPPHSITRMEIEGIGTVRGRLGYLMAPQWLIYGTGGLAYGHVATSSNYNFPPGFGAAFNYINPGQSVWNTGWTAGGGVEWAFASHLSLKVEYLYVALGHVNSVALPGAPTAFAVTNSWSTINSNIVRAGVNWSF